MPFVQRQRATTYSLPWYAIWGLPTLAGADETAAAELLSLRGATLAAAYEAGNVGLAADLRLVLVRAVPLALAVGMAWLAVRRRRSLSRGWRRVPAA